MKLLICGGRDFTRYSMVDALGADRLARDWAINNKIHFATVPAL